ASPVGKVAFGAGAAAALVGAAPAGGAAAGAGAPPPHAARMLLIVGAARPIVAARLSRSRREYCPVARCFIGASLISTPPRIFRLVARSPLPAKDGTPSRVSSAAEVVASASAAWPTPLHDSHTATSGHC